MISYIFDSVVYMYFNCLNRAKSICEWFGKFGRRLLIFSVALVGVSGCSPAKVLNAVISEDGYEVTKNIAYGDRPRQKLDVYVPVEVAAPAKVVIFFYGGSWQSGEKADYEFVGEAFSSQGFVTIIPDYRLYPEVLFPDFIDDGAQVARWVKSSIAGFGGDPQQIHLVGHSAGAHIAAMLALDQSWLEAGTIRAMIGLAGPYDFLPLKDDTLKIIFGPEPERARSQPINFVDGDEPPLLLLAGEDDIIVSPGNTKRLAARIRARGGEVQSILYPGIGHVGILSALAAPLRRWAPTLRDVTEFLRDLDDRSFNPLEKKSS